MTPIHKHTYQWILVCLLLALPTLADYSIPWSTLESGAVSSGGTYTLQGVAGQPDAFVQTGSGYILSGGFLPGMNYCRVDLNDLAWLTAHWLEALAADFNAAPPVDMIDFNSLSIYWLGPCPGDWPLN